MLVGLNSASPFDITVRNNLVDLENSYFSASAAGIVGSAYGFNLGMNASSPSSASNNVTIEDSKFYINSPSKEGWGIWMLPGSGTLAVSGNEFNLNIGSGGEIYGP